MIVLLDTTVLIDFLRGRPVVERVAELRRRGDRAATTPINIEELARGLRLSEHEIADRLIRGLYVLPITGAAGWRAGLWRRDYSARGITLSQADCLIGAVAVDAMATVATGNPKHFPMPELTLEHWPAGTKPRPPASS